jgi:RecA/RadA recombinase
MNTDKIKKDLMQKTTLKKLEYLSTGSTILNLACTDSPFNGFAKGKFHFIVGDSTSGKTFLSLTCLAEASINDDFKDYRFIYDNSEGGALMDIKKFFGSGVYDRIEPPAIDDDGVPLYSSTIEEFYFNIDDAIKSDKPFIYVLDSMDSLSSESEQEKFDEIKTALRSGKTTTGSFGDGKAKKNSMYMRKLLGPLDKNGSILIVINQTRDNLGFGFAKKSRSGGHALTYYACLELWSSVKGRIKKTIKNKPRQLGVLCQIAIKKNRFTGKENTVVIPIFHSYGIDDIGSCIDYLESEKHLVKKGNKLYFKELDIEGTRSKLISHIEENNLENEVRTITGKVWNEINDLLDVKRKRKYK